MKYRCEYELIQKIGRQQIVAARPGFAGSPSKFGTFVAQAYNELVLADHRLGVETRDEDAF